VKVARFTISSKEWGEVLILRPFPRPEEPWGDLAPLRGTPWGDQLPVVSGASLSHALHGVITPLMREIGPHPHLLCRKIPEGFRTCSISEDCLIATSDCVPGPKLPACYVPPGLSGEAARAAATVAEAWASGRYVIIVEGAEFSY